MFKPAGNFPRRCGKFRRSVTLSQEQHTVVPTRNAWGHKSNRLWDDEADGTDEENERWRLRPFEPDGDRAFAPARASGTQFAVKVREPATTHI